MIIKIHDRSEMMKSYCHETGEGKLNFLSKPFMLDSMAACKEGLVE